MERESTPEIPQQRNLDNQESETEERTLSFSEKKKLEEQQYLLGLWGRIANFEQLTYREWLSVYYNFRVTNNWLKMHNGIMERNGGKRGRIKTPPIHMGSYRREEE